MGCPKPVSVSGMTHHRLGRAFCRGAASWGTEPPSASPMDTEEAAVAFIRFEGKKSMSVTVSWAINGAEEDFNLRLYGTREGAGLNPFVIYSEANGYRADIRPVFDREDAWVEGFENEIRHFVGCVASHTQPIASAQSCCTVQRMIQAMYDSDAQGREILL